MPSNLVAQDTTTSRKRIKAKSNKESNQILSVSDDSASELVDVELVRNNRGRPVDPEMEYSTQACKNNDGKIWFRCKGKNAEGKTCPWRSSGRERSRVLRHCKSCHFLGVADRERADSQLANQSTGRKLQAIKRRTINSNNSPDRPTHTLLSSWGTQAEKDLQIRYQHSLVLLICGAGLSPYMTDGWWWKEFIEVTSSGMVQAVSGTTLATRLITEEAANVRSQMMTELQAPEVKWITLGFDGGSSKRRESFLTIHASTEARRAYFIDAVNTVRDSHTAQLYAGKVMEVRTICACCA